MHSLACDLWLLDRSALRQFASSLSISVSAESARAASEVRPKRQKAVAVVPVYGVIETRPSLIGEAIGMASYERIGQIFDAMMADESVSHVVLDVSSPGGMVYGASELANKIYEARGRKPIIAVANPLAASGAYWIAAAADRIVAIPSADVGSVGVIAQHFDVSESLQKEGVKATTIRSTKSPFKGETTDAEPLTEEARAHMQARADAIYERFVADLAKFRGYSVEHVVQRFGKGRTVDADRAKSAGMIDKVASFDQTIAAVMSGRVRFGERACDAEWDAPRQAKRATVASFLAASTDVEVR